MTGEVEELLRILGPFYELVDERKKITQISDLSTGWPRLFITGNYVPDPEAKANFLEAVYLVTLS